MSGTKTVNPVIVRKKEREDKDRSIARGLANGNAVRIAGDNDTIPNEEYGSQIRVLPDDYVALKVKVDKYLEEEVPEIYRRAAEMTPNGEGLSLSQIEVMLSETNDSPQEVAIASLEIARILSGYENTDTSNLPEAKRLLEEARDAGVFSRWGLGKRIEKTYDKILEAEETRTDLLREEAAERLNLERDQVRGILAQEEAKTDILRDEASERLNLERDQVRGVLAQEEARTDILRNEVAERLKLERVGVKTFEKEKARLEFEADKIRVRKVKDLDAYRSKLLEKIVELEGEARWVIWRDISMGENPYVIGEDRLRDQVREELTLGNNLEAFPVEVENERGEYKREFLDKYFKALVVRRFAYVEDGKDRAMIRALDILYQDLISDENNIPEISTVNLEMWENAMSKIPRGIEELVTIYKQNIIENQRLKDEIVKKMDSYTDGEMAFKRRAKFINDIFKETLDYSFSIDDVVDEPTLLSYERKVKEKFNRRSANIEDDTLTYKKGIFVGVNDGHTIDNLKSSGKNIYQIWRGSDKDFTIRDLGAILEGKNGYWLKKKDVRGYYNDSVALTAWLVEDPHVEALDYERFLNFASEIYNIEHEGSYLVDFQKHHPDFDIQFPAVEEFYNKMIARFENISNK